MTCGDSDGPSSQSVTRHCHGSRRGPRSTIARRARALNAHSATSRDCGSDVPEPVAEPRKPSEPRAWLHHRDSHCSRSLFGSRQTRPRSSGDLPLQALNDAPRRDFACIRTAVMFWSKSRRHRRRSIRSSKSKVATRSIWSRPGTQMETRRSTCTAARAWVFRPTIGADSIPTVTSSSESTSMGAADHVRSPPIPPTAHRANTTQT